MSCVSDAEQLPFSLIPLIQVSVLNQTKNIYQPEIPIADLKAKSKLLLFLQTAKRFLVFDGEGVVQAKNPPLV